MPRQYLMIETKDQRKFFTYQRHLPQLIEFGKTFDAEISVVRTSEPPLDLLSLAENLCDSEYKIHQPNFEVVEVKLARKRRRNKLLRQAKTIKRFIRQQLMAGESVSLRALAKRYKRYNLSLPTLCNHFSAIRKELNAEGLTTEKIGQGTYQITC